MVLGARHFVAMGTLLCSYAAWSTRPSQSTPIERPDETLDPARCRSTAQLLQGGHLEHGADRARWIGGTCPLQEYSDAMWRRCLAGRNIAAFGDSQLGGVVDSLAVRLGLPRIPIERVNYVTGHVDELMSRVWDAGSSNVSFILHQMVTTHPEEKRTRSMFNTTDAQHALLHADTILINHGAWEMGLQSCGVEIFYAKLKEHIEHLRAIAKPGAEVLLFNIPWIHRERCRPQGRKKRDYKLGPKTYCFYCNHPDKVQAYREANQLAGACTGTQTVETHMISRGAPNLTTDGLHYTAYLRDAELDVLGNVLCGPRAQRMATRAPLCEEHVYLARWRGVPEAYLGCHKTLTDCQQDKPRVFLNLSKEDRSIVVPKS